MKCSSNQIIHYFTQFKYKVSMQRRKVLWLYCIYIFYISDGLLVLNKPYGVGLSRSPTTSAQHSRHTDKVIVGQSQYFLTEALPHIAGNLGYNNLTVLKMPERFVFFYYALTKILSHVASRHSFYYILELHFIVNNISICLFHMHAVWFGCCFCKIHIYMKLIHRYQSKCCEIITELPFKYIASVTQQIKLFQHPFNNI
jgi:hypothetical protein